MPEYGETQKDYARYRLRKSRENLDAVRKKWMAVLCVFLAAVVVLAGAGINAEAGVSDVADLTEEIREDLAGTTVEATVTRASVSSDSLRFEVEFEYEGNLYKDAVSMYETGFSEERFVEWFREEKGIDIIDSDGAGLTFTDIELNDIVEITFDADGQMKSVTIVGTAGSSGITGEMMAAGFLPALFLLALVCLPGRRKGLPVFRIAVTLLLGSFMVFPVAYIEPGIHASLLLVMDAGSVPFALLYSFINVALVEEGCKFLVLLLMAGRCRRYTYRYDGVIFAAAASMGFAALENVFYFATYGTGIATIMTRALLASPGHCADAVFMGLYYSEAKLAAEKGDRGMKRRNLFLALAVPTLTHGLYDLPSNLFSGGMVSLVIQAVIAIAFDVAAILLVLRCAGQNQPLAAVTAGPVQGQSETADTVSVPERGETDDMNKNPGRRILFCPNCGSQLPAKALFCGNCGENLEDRTEDRISTITGNQVTTIS